MLQVLRKRNEKEFRPLKNSIFRRLSLLCLVVLVSLLSLLQPSDGQGMKISGTVITDENQARVAATGNSCRQGFPCGKYGQHYYWCWTSYRNGGDWDYCCAPGQTCARHGMNYDWCWADTKKNTWSYCKKSKLNPETPTSPPTTTTTKATTTTTTTATTRRRTTTTRPPTTTTTYRAKSYTQRGSDQLKGQIMDNVEKAVQMAVASSQQDIRKIDRKMERLEDNIVNQEQRIRKLDELEQAQNKSNEIIQQITKWIRYLKSTAEDLAEVKSKVDILTKESQRQKNSGFNQMYKNALKSNEIDNNSISSPFYNYQRKGPSASPISRKSSKNSAEAVLLAQGFCQTFSLSLAGFLGFAFLQRFFQ